MTPMHRETGARPSGTALIPVAVIVVAAVVAAVLFTRISWHPQWDYAQFYLFVWNDRASAGWFDGASGVSVERSVTDTVQPQRVVIGAVAEALGCQHGEELPRTVQLMTRCFGDEGWELVSSTETLHDGNLSPEVLVGRTYFFKRRR